MNVRNVQQVAALPYPHSWYQGLVWFTTALFVASSFWGRRERDEISRMSEGLNRKEHRDLNRLVTRGTQITDPDEIAAARPYVEVVLRSLGSWRYRVFWIAAALWIAVVAGTPAIVGMFRHLWRPAVIEFVMLLLLGTVCVLPLRFYVRVRRTALANG